MAAPMPSMSAASSAKSGDSHSSSSFLGGDFTFGGSGTGGSGSFNIGGLVSQYWPLLAVAGAVWWLKYRKN